MSSRISPRTSKAVLTAIVSVLFAVLIFVVLWGVGNWNPTGINSSTATGAAQKAACCGGIAGLLGVLLFILSREYLREAGEIAPERPVWFYPLMAGLLSAGAMCVAYSFVGMWPFGEKSAMMVDMHHQYAPLLSELRYDLLHGDSPLYSFEVGLGANYLSLFGYYLASPFNLFLLLFPERLLAQGILFVTLLKNALSGALFALCVQQLFGKRGLYIPTVSVMYSLMVYLIAYSWNLMWLDVVMILPLVVYGFERLMHTGKFLTYVLSLAYALYANYYIGFMLCIFLVLYYLAYCLRSRRSGKEIGTSFARFAGFSVLSAGLVAALLIPVYLALQHTSAAGAELPDITNTLDIFQLLGRHLADTSPTVRAGNLPNIYCGVLTAICVPLFAVNKGIAPRRRAAYMALWLVLFFSFLVNWTDLAWHGLHSPNDLPYRFSFLYSFFLLLMACETLIHLKNIETRHVCFTFAGAVAYLMLEEHFGDEAYGFSTVYINLAIIAIYTVILLLSTRKLLRRRLAYALLLLAVTAEMALGGGSTFVKLNANEYFTRHVDYLDNETTEAIRAAVEKTEQLGDAAADGDFYRLEFLPRRTCVDTAMFHYRGLTSFSSSNYFDTTRVLGGLGYAINGVNSHLYKSYQPFTDSLLGIRYVIFGEDETAPSQLKYLETVTVGNTTYAIYENPFALGLGYVVDEDVKDYSYTRYDPFTSQNDLFSSLCNNYSPLYTLYDISTEDSTVGVPTGSGSGFRLYVDEENRTASFTVTLEENASLFLYADCGAAEDMTIDLGDQSWSVSPHEPYIINGGVAKAGTVARLTVTSDVSCSGNFYVASFNQSAFAAAMSTLSDNQLVIDDLGSSRLSGSINAENDGVLMTSIPYDSGWSVTVDGKEVKTFSTAGGFLGFDLASGEHTVTLTYIPEGLIIGLAVSAASLAALLILLIVSAVRRKKTALGEALDYENAQPIQKGFSVTDEPLTDLPPLPDTLQELTDNTPEQA